jgi:hypothetical protein
MQIVLYVVLGCIGWMALAALAVAIAGAARRGDEALHELVGMQIDAPVERPRTLAIEADVMPVARPWIVARAAAEAGVAVH